MPRWWITLGTLQILHCEPILVSINFRFFKGCEQRMWFEKCPFA
jgi:hypothetical protein